MLKNRILCISVALFSCLGAASANDLITEIKLNIYPNSAKVRPFETAVIQAEFYGVKKKGWFERIFGGGESKKSRIQSNDWNVRLREPGGGWLSKPFLFQQESRKEASGIENFIRQGLNAALAKDAILYSAPEKPGKYAIKITAGNLSEEIVIEVSDSAPPNREGVRIRFSPTSKPSDPYFELAEHYAPFIAQETWFNPRADYLVRFDYDGNWKGDDNWENLSKSASQAFVYYAVMETESHWFLQYNFFHARDYSDVCIVGTCHENDNEGLILAVRKDGSKLGKLELMETLAHNAIHSFTNDPGIRNGILDIDGKIDLYEGVRPVVFVEAGGHGILGSSHKDSRFRAEKLEFAANTGVTYVYKGTGESPKHPNDRNVGYALLPIYDQWWSKGNQETPDPNETFERFYAYAPFGNRPGTRAKYIAGAFKGRTAGENLAKPFWAWHDNKTRDKRIINTGQWALDPAYSMSKSLIFPDDKPVSVNYIFNPFLAIETGPKP